MVAQAQVPLGAQGGHLGEVSTRAAAAGPAPGCRALAQLPAVCDNNLLGGLPILGAKRFYFLHNIHALFDVAKHNMFAIQPARAGEPGEQKMRVMQCQPTS